MRAHRVDRILFTESDIQRRVLELAAEVSRSAAGDTLHVIGILRGSFIFLADLIRSFHAHEVRTRIDFMLLQSYGAGTESSGVVRLVRDFDLDVRGADVLVVDDILDSGRTLAFAARHVAGRGAARVRTCVLLDKPARRAVPFEADFAAFACPDEFVVGYGLDYDHLYRDLPWIAAVSFQGPAL